MFWNVVIGLPFWLAILANNKNQIRSLEKRDYSILAGIVLVSSITQTLIDMLAIKYTPAINYSFLTRTAVLFTFVFAAAFLAEKLTRRKIAIAAVIVGGAWLLTTGGQSISIGIGDALTILDAALISFGNTILGKMATARMKPMFVVSATAVGAALPEAGLALYLGHTIAVNNILLVFSLVFLYLVLNSIRFIAYKYASAAMVASFMSLTPFIVLLLAVPLLGESMSPIQLAGGFLVMAASIFAVKSKI
ncbi:MAG: DMT family transporter [Candidatus Pacebacteria bacterium]|jgi:drug/metabolite transporter (DMT)-like permease|nr:DMT family transporter [Candidatus Paceibacterota bacterium]